MNEHWEHNEGRPASMKDVNAILADISKGAANNPPVFALNNLELMRARNNGLPRAMYHETLEPALCITELQVERLTAMGYVPHYIHRKFPKFVFRRNLSSKFALMIDPATKQILNHEFVEQRKVNTAQQLEQLRKERIPNGCGPWFERVTEIPELEEAPSEDPNMTIARLQAQVADMAAALLALQNKPDGPPGHPQSKRAA